MKKILSQLTRFNFCLIFGLAMLLLFVNSCKKELYVKEEIDPAQRAKISEYLKSPKIQTISFDGFSKNVNMASLGNLKEVMLNSENVSNGRLMAVGQNASKKPRYKVNIDSAKLLVINGQSNYIFSIAPVSPRAITFRNLTISKKGSTVIAFLTTYTPTRKWAHNYRLGKKEKFQGRIVYTPINLNDTEILTIGQESKSVLLNTMKQQKTMQGAIQNNGNVTDCISIPIYGQEAYYCASGTHGPEDTCYLTGGDRPGYNTVVVRIEYDCTGGGNNGGGGEGTTPGPPSNYNPCDEAPDENTPGENQVPNMEDDEPICGPVTNNPREIKIDPSITNNLKINCLLNKLLGLNGTSGNAEFKSLLAAFTAKGFDVTFKIGTTKPDSKGETSPDQYNPTKYIITLNANKINTENQMSWAKTILHEAFHANLMQKSYEMFGDHAVGLWAIGPKYLTLEELIDKIESVAQPQPTLAQKHHEFMAMNIEIIKNGLKSFSLANNSNHSDYNDDHFTAMAYEGLNNTSYYLNKVTKDSNGNNIMVFYSGQNRLLSDVHGNRSMFLGNNSVIPCN